MNTIISSLFSLLAGCFCCCGQQKYMSVGVEEFEKVIAADSVQTVDVRTADEFSEGHIAVNGVINIDFKDADFMKQAAERLDKSRTVAVYCLSGRRSADAAKLLSEAGYTVIDLKGGILEWQKQGRPITDR